MNLTFRKEGYNICFANTRIICIVFFYVVLRYTLWCNVEMENIILKRKKKIFSSPDHLIPSMVLIKEIIGDFGSNLRIIPHCIAFYGVLQPCNMKIKSINDPYWFCIALFSALSRPSEYPLLFHFQGSPGQDGPMGSPGLPGARVIVLMPKLLCPRWSLGYNLNFLFLRVSLESQEQWDLRALLVCM